LMEVRGLSTFIARRQSRRRMEGLILNCEWIKRGPGAGKYRNNESGTWKTG